MTDIETYVKTLNERLEILYEDLDMIDRSTTSGKALVNSILEEIDMIESELIQIYGSWDQNISEYFNG